MNHLLNKVIKVPVRVYPKPDIPDYLALTKPKKMYWTYQMDNAPSWSKTRKAQPWL
jgi:hypothetical protein